MSQLGAVFEQTFDKEIDIIRRCNPVLFFIQDGQVKGITIRAVDARKSPFGLELPNCQRCGEPFVGDPKKRSHLMLKHHTYGQRNESAPQVCGVRSFVRAPDGGKYVGNAEKTIIYGFPDGLRAAQDNLEQQAIAGMKDVNET